MRLFSKVVYSPSLVILLCLPHGLKAQPRIPASYSNLSYNDSGLLIMKDENNTSIVNRNPAPYSLSDLQGKARGTSDGVEMDLGKTKGSITYGIIPYGLAPHPLAVYRFTRPIINGKVTINILKDFSGVYDMIGWQKSGQLSFGYRIFDEKGMIIYDGVLSVTGKGPFEVAPSLYEGPYVNEISHNKAVIWCKTDKPVKASVQVGGKTYSDPSESTHHQWTAEGLTPGKEYSYTVSYGSFKQTYSFKTAPAPGSRKPFTFAYCSDSRHASGGGERMIYGANGYIMKKIAALAHQQKAAFMQFTGDMINGYTTTMEEQQLQYTNWKKSIEPWWHYMPVYAGMGNHEALGYVFQNAKGGREAFIDKFPYESESAEAAFQEAFVNPVSDLESEDGSRYDPDPNHADFPSYRESVFYYTYDNVAVVVLNSNYWYAPSGLEKTGGNLHAYLMDNQLAWLDKTIALLEKDKSIDHIFVTQHTPAFPNGGHVKDDMWYGGNNSPRPYVAGKPVEKGIIERRDEYLNILVNKSNKVLAILTGDEHNYNRLKIDNEVPVYPEGWTLKKLRFNRHLYQINNGAAGAPYYAQEQAPWSGFTKAFSVQNALCLFDVAGPKVLMRVLNPDTLNEIDRIQLR
jgi:hypothetical protein